MKLTNTHKHFVLMLLLGILAWAFAYFGKAQGLGYFPNIAAFMITVWVEYRQWVTQRSAVHGIAKSTLAGLAG